MLSKVRWLSRLELAVETLRLALVSLVKVDREWSEGILPPSWEDQYGERFVMQQYTEKEWKEYEANIGNDGQWLLNRLVDGGAPAGLQELSEIKLLKTVWAEQFREETGKMVLKRLKKYAGHTQIVTPHDPEARYSRKRNAEWIGDKVQVTDTDDADYPHNITDIVSTGRNHTDHEALADIQDRLEQRQCKPGEHYVDAGTITGSNLANKFRAGVDDDDFSNYFHLILHYGKWWAGIFTEFILRNSCHICQHNNGDRISGANKKEKSTGYCARCSIRCMDGDFGDCFWNSMFWIFMCYGGNFNYPFLLWVLLNRPLAQLRRTSWLAEKSATKDQHDHLKSVCKLEKVRCTFFLFRITEIWMGA